MTPSQASCRSPLALASKSPPYHHRHTPSLWTDFNGISGFAAGKPASVLRELTLAGAVAFKHGTQFCLVLPHQEAGLQVKTMKTVGHSHRRVGYTIDTDESFKTARIEIDIPTVREPSTQTTPTSGLGLSVCRIMDQTRLICDSTRLWTPLCSGGQTHLRGSSCSPGVPRQLRRHPSCHPHRAEVPSSPPWLSSCVCLSHAACRNH